MNKKIGLLSVIFCGVLPLFAGQATNLLPAPGGNAINGASGSGVNQGQAASPVANGMAPAAPAAPATPVLTPTPASNAIPVVSPAGVAPAVPVVPPVAGAVSPVSPSTPVAANTPTATGVETPSIDKKFLVPIDVTQKAVDDATAFVPSASVDGKERAVCFAGAKGAELPGYFLPGEQLSDPATTCVVLDPASRTVQKNVDASQIMGFVSTTPLQWSTLQDAKPDQIWFVRQQMGVCSSRDKDGKLSSVGSFDLNDPNKACYLNDRIAGLADRDIVVLLK